MVRALRAFPRQGDTPLRGNANYLGFRFSLTASSFTRVTNAGLVDTCVR